MASSEAIQRLESKASAAEQLIVLLRQEIESIKRSAPSTDHEAEISKLQKDNAILKSEIEAWKSKLVKAEVANGVPQVPAPGKSASNAVSNEVPPSSGNASQRKEPEGAEKKNIKEEKKPKKENNKATGDGGKKQQPKVEEAAVHVGRLDMRVGIIKSAKRHPDADGLYVEEVDVGEEKPRTVISGLVKFISLDEMQNRRAILLCNLKPAKMRGILSEAMVMCASTPEKVEILAPPEDAQVGDPILIDGFEHCPDKQLNPKKKIFEACAPDLKVNSSKEATYKGVPWTVNGKKCHSQTLVDVQIK